MTSPSKSAPALPAPDPQLVVALQGHGDALILLRDALRWRAIERHLHAYESNGYTGIGIRYSLFVQGRCAPVAGAVVDAYMQALRLGVNVCSAPIEEGGRDAGT